jgi:osmotically-inducible protein OsmY
MRSVAKRSGRYTVFDWWIALKARLRLAWDFVGLADSFTIRVRCKEGHLTLSGSAKNEYRRCRAEEAVRRVAGVVRVSNKLRARGPQRLERRTHVVLGPYPVVPCPITIEEPPRRDRMTSEAVLEALKEEGMPTGEGGVRVCAVGRTVYLLGTARGEAAAQTAERVALALPRVEQVRNKLQRPPGRPRADAMEPGRQSRSAGEARR